MNDLLFYAILLALLYYFFVYLPQQRKSNYHLPTYNSQSTQTNPIINQIESELKATIQQLEQELLGEKQLSQKQKEVYQRKTKHLQTLLQEHSGMVYRTNAAPQQVPYSQALAIAESDQHQLGLLLKDLGYPSLTPVIDIEELKTAIKIFRSHQQVDQQKYEERLRNQRAEYIQLEKKLEKIRDLLGTNQLTKLQALYKKGEI